VTVLGAPAAVLFVDHARAIGGAEKSLLLLLEHMDRDSWVPYLACQSGLLADAARDLDVAVVDVPLPRLRRSVRFAADLRSGAGAIQRAAAEVGAAVVHSNTVRATTYAAFATTAVGAALSRAPGAQASLVWHMRDFSLGEGPPRHGRLDTAMKRVIASRCVHIVANSQAVAETLPGRTPITVVHNAVDASSYRDVDPTPFRERYGLRADQLVIGTVGRLRPWKGQDRFLRVAATVLRQVDDVTALVVGGTVLAEPDSYGEELRALAERLGIADRVVFTGHLEDVRPALAAMDVFVHAGAPEPFGLVNIEAMASALPVVAFAHGALPEIVADGRTGLLVPPGDERALAEAVLRLLRNPEERRAMGESARARAVSAFSPERMASEIEAVWSVVYSRREA